MFPSAPEIFQHRLQRKDPGGLVHWYSPTIDISGYTDVQISIYVGTTTKNMDEVEGEEAEKLTYFMYEEILAFKRAAQATGLSTGDVEDVFYNNSKSLIDSVK